MAVQVKIDGLKALEAQIERLKRSTGKAALRRGLMKAAVPLAEDMRQRAPDDPSTTDKDLHRSIGVGTKLSPRQQALHRKMFRNDRSAVEVFVGAGSVPHAHMQEFGTRHHGAQPFARPAWKTGRDALIERLKDELAAEISKSINRAARRGSLLK